MISTNFTKFIAIIHSNKIIPFAYYIVIFIFMEGNMFRCPYFYNMTNVDIYEQMNNEIIFDNMMRCYDERVSPRKNFTTEEAILIGKYLKIKFDKFDVEQFRIGLDVELEHGNINPITNVTNDDPIITGKIALAHLNEFPDYYQRLKKMEEEAEEYLGK